MLMEAILEVEHTQQMEETLIDRKFRTPIPIFTK